jgi:hypothetical protein
MMQSMLIRVVGVSIACVAVAACSNYVPLGPADAGTTSAAASTTPTTPTAPTTPPPPPPTPPATPAASTAVAYTDLQPIFASDCVPCHGGSRAAGRYAMTSYAAVMAAVRAGNAASALVVVTQPGGVMYPFLTGDRATKAAMIRTWVVNGAPQSR